jgi:predicted CopG family antitoxin
MGTRNVRLDEDLYERIEAHKRENESFSDAIDRLTSDYSLLDFAGGYSEEEAEKHRELLERSEEVAAEDRRELLDRLGVDTE